MPNNTILLFILNKLTGNNIPVFGIQIEDDITPEDQKFLVHITYQSINDGIINHSFGFIDLEDPELETILNQIINS